MIGEKKDHGVLRETFAFQQLQHGAHLGIERGQGIEIRRPVIANHRIVREIGMQLHGGGVDRVARGLAIDTVRFGEIYLRVERRARLEIAPIGAVELLAGLEKIPVGLSGALETEFRRQLADVRGEVARVAQALRQQLHAGRTRIRRRAMAAMIGRADAGLENTCHKRRARRRANRRR